MKQTGYVYWQDGELWLGYLNVFPDYVTQGGSLADLEVHLQDIYRDVAGGKIPRRANHEPETGPKDSGKTKILASKLCLP